MTALTRTDSLARLHLRSRRAPSAALALLACGATLHVVLRWTPATGTFATQLPMLLIGAAATAVAATLRSPFDESERVTGGRLPLLRLGTGTALTLVAYAALAGGAADAHLIFGATGLLRNLIGVVGVTLLTATLAGAELAWAGTLGYLLLTMTALALGWTTPWLWAARPPADTGATICAALSFAAGLAAVTVHGPRETTPA